MLVDEAKLENGWLMLHVPYPADAMRWLMTFTAGKEYELKQVRRKRSLDANAYCWVLLDKLAEKLRMQKTELYQRYIREIGGVSETYCGTPGAVKKLAQEWETNGLGYQAEVFPSKIPGCQNVTLYYGSSSFDTAQMARLIDAIAQDCLAIGIETRPEEEINAMLSQWGEKL